MTPTLPSAQSVAASVRERGAGIWPGFLNDAQLQALRNKTDELLTTDHTLAFPKSSRVWDLYRHGQVFVDLLSLRHLEQLLLLVLGKHYLLSDYSLNVVNPGQPRDDWHLDYPFNEMPTLVHGSVLGVQCVLTLDTFTADNGATQYLPVSHRPPQHPDPSASDEHETFHASAGTLMIMAASTWHRSGYNATEHSRSAILLSFVERWIRPMSDPPEPGPWSTTPAMRLLLGQERPPETINGVPIDGPLP